MQHTAAVGAVRRHLDRLGDQQWAPMRADLPGRVCLEVHRRFLDRFVPRGARVLEVGVGPYTVELAARGCRVVVTDPSATRLATHRRSLRDQPAETCVLRREQRCAEDTAGYRDGEFDAVLAYGVALPSCAARATATLRGLLRVVGPAGVVVASVTSLLGTWRCELPRGLDPTEPPPAAGHRPLRWDDVRTLVDDAGGAVVDGSASNWASLGDRTALARLEADRGRWERFLELEIAACAEPGARDGGTHILFAARPTGIG